MPEEKILPLSKKGLNAMSVSLKVFKKIKQKPKLTARQFALLTDVKVMIKGLKVAFKL